MILEFFQRYLLSQRTGSLVRILSRIALIAIALSVCALIVVSSVMKGFGAAIEQRLLVVEPDLLVEGEKDKLSFIKEKLDSRSSLRVHPVITQDVILRTVEGLYGGAQLKNVQSTSYKELLQSLEKIKVKDAADVPDFLSVEEKKIEEASTHLSSNQIVMGIDLASSLGVLEGDEVVLVAPEVLLLPPGEVPSYEKATVTRILRTNVPDFDSQVILYSEGLKKLRRAYGRTEKLEIKVQNRENLEPLVAEIKKMGGQVSTWRERNSALFYSLKMEKLLMTLCLGLTLLIGSFSVITVIVLIVIQKRSEIGILRAMGLSSQKAQRLFTFLGGYLSLLGIGLGLILGTISILVIKHASWRLPDFYYDTHLPVEWDMGNVSIVLIIVSIVSWFSAWLSSRQVLQLDIVSSIRQKH